MEDKAKSPYLFGKLLIAMPGLGDPRFYRAVIFLCSHDQSGAMGLVINQVLPGMEFSSLLDQSKIASNIKVEMKNISAPVFSGGPVESSRGFLLHSADFRQKDTVTIDKNYGITGTLEALAEVAKGKGPEHLLFLLGYAGWGAGQLENEIQDNAWLVADPDPAIIFESAPDDKWTRAVEKLGVDPGMLSVQAGRA